MVRVLAFRLALCEITNIKTNTDIELMGPKQLFPNLKIILIMLNQAANILNIIKFCFIFGLFLQFLLSVSPSYGENNGQRPFVWRQGRPPSPIPTLSIPRIAPQPDKLKKRNIDYLLFNGPKETSSKQQAFTPLMKVAQSGNLTGARHIIDEGASINAFTDTGVTALMLAAKNGHLEIVKLLYEHGAEINSHSFGPMANMPQKKGHPGNLNNQIFLPFQIDPKYYDSTENGFTPLTLAISYGHKDVVEFFISENADLNMKGFGASPLAVALYYGQPELAISLIQNGAELNQSKQMVGRQGDLFEQSLQRRYWDIATFFVDKGEEDLNAIAPRIAGIPLLHYYATTEDTTVIEFLCQKGADPNLVDTNGMSPILYASWKGRQQTVKLLLSLGADINSACLSDKKTMYSSAPGSTPLILAILERHFDLVKFLIKNGADIDKGDQQGITPLVHTLRKTFEDTLGLTRKVAEKNTKDCFDLADFLLNNGANINAQNNKGDSPLFDATASGSLAVMEYLITKGADVNLTNNKGQTPVIIAVSRKKIEKVRTLIKSGIADLNKKDLRGQSPLRLSMENKDVMCGTLLVSHGADVNETLGNGDPLLLRAVSHNIFDFAELLIEKGADVNATDKNGNTSLMVASEKSNLSIVKKLISHGAKINTLDNAGINAFALAKFSGDQSIIRYLEENGADTSVWEAHVLRVKYLQSTNILPKDNTPNDFHPRRVLLYMKVRKISM
ncbi:ankyrin repeat-containing protein [Desulfocapsa sulfexigens DSM 10523]|uniref:Ankyrin repeat-containing protein n=1 Tax=Desulfocapsa sulfexigens (strain DSM 10523 / SB164P1) TaxID=1167006 RepID=M1P427_DESSD|nr:ankyrin repeat domain-containing protein [Desulfocapsa sulfexigens]AGF78238.1 ankyrin repeat-containing protein [Desulfocapsa sulfexigens DSM 10523]